MAFLRTLAEPAAALVFSSPAESPPDWPRADGSTEANLGHALGWTCEVGRDRIVLLNPLGEGLVRAPLPELTDAWLEHCRHDGSCAIYLVGDGVEASFAELIVAEAGAAGALHAATVRTAIADDFGAPPKVGRNEPCYCGSGKKFKHCHG